MDKYNIDNDCADCVNQLLQRKPESRLGIMGSDEVKQHPWF